MDERRAIRASDTDREAAVARLRAAMDEGRLNVLEYDERIARAYQALTYGDLADLFVDLPLSPAGKPGKLGKATGRMPLPDLPTAHFAPPPVPVHKGVFASLPTALRVLWTIWLTAVSINLVVWVLVSVSNANPHYFWPMWVAGPAGAGLFGLSAGVTMVRRGREAARAQREITG